MYLCTIRSHGSGYGVFGSIEQNAEKKTVVVMENAAVHPSEALEECLPRWKKKGLIIKYLSTYSPELNLVEILWRKIKYTWLPFSAYQCLNALRDALDSPPDTFTSHFEINI